MARKKITIAALAAILGLGTLTGGMLYAEKAMTPKKNKPAPVESPSINYDLSTPEARTSSLRPCKTYCSHLLL